MTKPKAKKSSKTDAQQNTLAVVQVGWENQNDVTPIILTGARNRERLGLNLRDVVKVVCGGVSVVSIVERQFKQHLATDRVQPNATINIALARKFVEAGVSESDLAKVQISKEVTESEVARFMSALESHCRSQMSNFLQALRGRMQ